MSTKKALHFGAGNIGRGFIGPLLVQSGFHVVFADVIKDVIDNINKLGQYHVHILHGGDHKTLVKNISGIISLPPNVIKEIADPNVVIITTSVGVGILPRIAPAIAKGLQERRQAGGGPINVIACENTVGATAQLAKAIDTHLSDEDREYVKKNVGFATCSVDRIVPPFEHVDPLDVGVEDFYEWIVERSPLKGLNSEGTIGVEGMLLTDDLGGYVERKLFTLNTGHAITAYLGSIRGYETIDESIGHGDILPVVRGAMHESGAALRKKHPLFTADEHAKYIEKIVERFKNPSIKDYIKRVGREPQRKLGKGDRLLGPANMAIGYGLPIDNLARGIAAAFLFENSEDEQAVELQKTIKAHGIEKTIIDVTGFAKDSGEYRKVFEAYGALEKQKVAK